MSRPARPSPAVSARTSCWPRSSRSCRGGPGVLRRARATTPPWSPLPGGACVATTDAMVRGRDWRDEWSSGARRRRQGWRRRTSPTSPPWAPCRPRCWSPWSPTPATRWPGCEDFARGPGRGGRAAGVPVVGRRPVLRAGGDPGRVGHRAGRPGRAGPRCCARGRGPGDVVARRRQRSGARRPGCACCRRARQAADGAGALRPGGLPPAPRTDLAAGPGGRGRRGDARCSTSATACCATRGRIARASGVGLDLDAALHRRRRGRAGAAARRARRPCECVLTGGEEHSLLATLPRRRRRCRPGWRAARARCR